MSVWFLFYVYELQLLNAIHITGEAFFEKARNLGTFIFKRFFFLKTTFFEYTKNILFLSEVLIFFFVFFSVSETERCRESECSPA